MEAPAGEEGTRQPGAGRGRPRTARPQLRAARGQTAAPRLQVTPHRGEKGEGSNGRPAFGGHPRTRAAAVTQSGAASSSRPHPRRGGPGPCGRHGQAPRSPGPVRAQPSGSRSGQVSAAAARSRGREAAPRAGGAGHLAGPIPAGLHDALGGSAPSRSSRPVKTQRYRRRPLPLTYPQRLSRPPPASQPPARPARSTRQRAPSTQQPTARREAPAPTGTSRLRPRPAVTLPPAPANGARAAEPLTSRGAGRRLRRTKARPRPARPSPRTCSPPGAAAAAPRGSPRTVPAVRSGWVGRTGRKRQRGDERPVPRPGWGGGVEAAAPPGVQTNGGGESGR